MKNLGFLCLSIILLICVFILINGEVVTSNSSAIFISSNVKHFLWQDDGKILLQKDLEILSFDLENRKSTHIMKIDPQTSIGLSEGNKLLVCQWKNHKILKPNENATKITLKNESNVSILHIQLNETVKISLCNDKRLLLETSHPFLEKKYYSYEISNKKLIESVLPQLLYTNSGIETTYLYKQGELIENLPIANNWNNIKINKRNSSYGLLSKTGDLWIVSRREEH